PSKTLWEILFPTLSVVASSIFTPGPALFSITFWWIVLLLVPFPAISIPGPALIRGGPLPIWLLSIDTLVAPPLRKMPCAPLPLIVLPALFAVPPIVTRPAPWSSIPELALPIAVVPVALVPIEFPWMVALALWLMKLAN